MESKKKRGRPRNVVVYKASPELLEQYLNGVLKFEEAVREKTCADCTEFKTLRKSLCNEEIPYHNVYPKNLGKEYARYEYFRIINLETGEIFERGRYMSKEDFRYYVNNSRYRLDVGR